MVRLPFVRAFLVDASTLHFEGMFHCLSAAGCHSVGAASSPQDAVKALELFKPNLCFIGPTLEDIESLTICRTLTEHSPQLQVILLTRHSEDPLFQVDAAAAGAAAWFPHDVNHIELVIIVVAWMHGLEFLPRKQYLKNAAPIELTARELDILQLMAEDKADEDIARRLVIAKDTVRTHAKSILRKLQVKSRAEAVRRARRRGLI